MKKLLRHLSAVLFCLVWHTTSAAEPAAENIEQQVAAMVQSEETTVVHLWAPWCPNCRAELVDGAWTRFIEANPTVRFVFVTIWSEQSGESILAQEGITDLDNVTILHHENTTRRGPDRVHAVAGVPVSWIPSTAILAGGHLQYLIGYGEVRFPMLQQMLNDSRRSWSR